MRPPRRWRLRLIGLASGAFGLVLVFTIILVLNGLTRGLVREPARAESALAIERREKPPEPRPLRREEPPPRPRRQAPAPPSLGLEAGLPGLDFGLPGFEDAELAGLREALLGGDQEVVMTDDSVDVPPRPVLQTPLRYPVRAKAQGITGYVVLSLLIGPTGQVEQVRVLEAQPEGVFDEAAVEGVRSWRFEPASYKGQSVRVWARQRIRFDLS
ncbi:MAG: energy transducer TonB [Xanthomonadales bacterium]|nr:energy transducer TonB [Xanthomonadales bacterium]